MKHFQREFRVGGFRGGGGVAQKSSRYCKRKHTSGLGTQASLQGYAALMNFERPNATSEVKKCIHYKVP